jgi:hypothetical protein
MPAVGLSGDRASGCREHKVWGTSTEFPVLPQKKSNTKQVPTGYPSMNDATARGNGVYSCVFRREGTFGNAKSIVLELVATNTEREKSKPTWPNL